MKNWLVLVCCGLSFLGYTQNRSSFDVQLGYGQDFDLRLDPLRFYRPFDGRERILGVVSGAVRYRQKVGERILLGGAIGLRDRREEYTAAVPYQMTLRDQGQTTEITVFEDVQYNRLRFLTWSLDLRWHTHLRKKHRWFLELASTWQRQVGLKEAQLFNGDEIDYHKNDDMHRKSPAVRWYPKLGLGLERQLNDRVACYSALAIRYELEDLWIVKSNFKSHDFYVGVDVGFRCFVVPGG